MSIFHFKLRIEGELITYMLEKVMKNLGLRGKLFILSGTLLFMCAITGIVGYLITDKVVSSYQKIDEFNLPNIKAILAAQSSNRSMRIQLLRLSFPGAPKEIKENALKKYHEDWKTFDNNIAAYLAVPFGPGEKELYDVLDPKIKSLHALTDKAVAVFQEMKDENDTESRKKLNQLVLKDVENEIGPFKDAQNAIIKYHNDYAVENSNAAHTAKSNGTKMLIGLVFASLVIGFVFAMLLSNSLVKVFKEISNSLTQSGSEVSSASEQVASSSEQLSQAVHEQAAALQETASSLEELSSTISKNTDTSKLAATSSKRSQDSANHGKSVVEEMIQSMNDINSSNATIGDQINQSNQQIGEIVKVITEIGNKTKVINDIVFQTKLLSFNASVEAARAGENGKGFAVVAEEVGNLARMSGSAATEISDMLDESIKTVSQIVQDSQEKINRMMGDGKKKVERGATIAQECGKVFNQIYDDISIINGMSGEISNASMEQSSGVQEISKAMNQLDLATQQNSAVSQQAASAAEELSAQATSMKQTVDQLIKLVEGGKNNENHSRHPHQSTIRDVSSDPIYLKRAS